MNYRALRVAIGRCGGVLAVVLVTGCSGLLPKAGPPPALHTLDVARPAAGQADAALRVAPASAPTLVVNPPHAAAGFDSRHMVYVRVAHQVEYFAHNEWVDTPARMLAPLLVAALERRAAFHAVVLTPSASAGDLSLDTQILRLQHDFGVTPSSVRFTLRADLVERTTRRVLGSREFDVSVPAGSEDPHGGVVAANLAVERALAQLAEFCADAASQWQPVASAAAAAAPTPPAPASKGTRRTSP
jgi:cholesterol transport system auxiliary component